MNETVQRPVRVALVQMSMTDDLGENLRKAGERIAEAAGGGAQIVVLPELFTAPYFCQSSRDEHAFSLAESIPGTTTQMLAQLAKKHRIVLIGGSIFEAAGDGKYYNTACVFGPDGALLGSYRKSHIPHDPLFYEQDYFAPGDTGIAVHQTPYGSVAVLICYDQWFPEAARIAALRGAELIVYPTAIAVSGEIEPVTPGIPEDWELMWRSAQVGHAACNCVYVAAVNRVGVEGAMRFWGGSFVADPGARILVQGDARERILYADCDLAHVRRMQESWRFLRERRRDLYRPLCEDDLCGDDLCGGER